MKTRILCVLLLLVGIKANAQLNAPSTQMGVKGNFHVWVDDNADFYLNGKKIHAAPYQLSQSPEVELKVGDRLVVHLLNKLDKRAFMALFLSTDKTQVIAFKMRDFKQFEDATTTDFTQNQFLSLNKSPKPVDAHFRKLYFLPIKSEAQWMWGDSDNCAIGCIISAQMFTENLHH